MSRVWYKVMGEDFTEYYDGFSLKEAREVAKAKSKERKETMWVINYAKDYEVAMYENGKEI